MDLNNRRDMLKAMGAAVTGGFMASSLGYAANETIQVGIIGTGGRAQALMKALAQIPGVRMTAVCDVWDKHLADGKEIAGSSAFATKNYREILDRKDIDAVVIGTPNHQHVPMLTEACSAGKDVYVEKPLTHRLNEAPAAVEAQNRHKRIVQVGQQQRSMPQFQKGYELVKSGQLGGHSKGAPYLEPQRRARHDEVRHRSRNRRLESMARQCQGTAVRSLSLPGVALVLGFRRRSFSGSDGPLYRRCPLVSRNRSSRKGRDHRRQVHFSTIGNARYRADTTSLPRCRRANLFRIHLHECAERSNARVHG